MYQRILVPIDGSETAERGLIEALGLARQCDATVQLLHVVADLQWVLDPLTMNFSENLRQEQRRYGEKVLAQAVQTCESHGVVSQTRLRDAASAAPGHDIVKEVQTSAANLVVMGTHGRRGVSRMLLGSDALIVVANSPVPVLLVRLSNPPA